MSNSLIRDILKAFRTGKWERTDGGVRILGRLEPAGFLRATLIGGPTFENEGPWSTGNHNMVVTEGLIYDLAVAMANGTKIAQWYVAPFKGSGAPQLTWTAANFNSNAQEFTNYTEATRPALVFPAEGAITTATIENDNTAITTIGSGGDLTLYGGGIRSTSAKLNATGKLWGAVQFSAPRANLVTGDALAWVYGLTAGNPA
jgi:hypothetical protein